MRQLEKKRSKGISTAGVLAFIVSAGCTDLPTSTPEKTISLPSAPVFATFSNTGALYFDQTATDCAFNTGTGNIDCHWTLKGLAAGDYASFNFTAYWDIPVYCESARGKLAPSKLQPVTPYRTYTGGGIGNLLMDANGEYVWAVYTIYAPGGLSSAFFCPKRAYNVAVFGVPQPVSWAFHAFKLGEEFTNFADASGTLP